MTAPPSVEELFDRAKSGERRALGRLLTLVERGGSPADEIAELTHALAGRAHVVGMTGAPGAGKSTLTGRLAARVAQADHPVGILAIDPSSPLTGGAILGDRIRMDHHLRPGTAFVRSMATRGHGGGLALAVPGAIRVLDAVGYDPVIVETVGVGQVEVEIAGAADTTVVVVTPGWGDAVQANKAGLLEVADVFVVNKADRPGASDARRDLELMLDLSELTGSGLSAEWRAPVVMATATEGEGIDELWEAIGRHDDHLRRSHEREHRRVRRARAEVDGRIEQLLAETVAELTSTTAGEAILAELDARTISPATAARRLVEHLFDRSGGDDR